MASMITIEDFEVRNAEIVTRIRELEASHAGTAFSEATRSEWNELNEELEGNKELIRELRARQDRIAELVESDEHTEEPERSTAQVSGRRTARLGGSRVPDDVHDLAAYRGRSMDMDDYRDLMNEGARRSLETAVFPHERARGDLQREHITTLLDREAEHPVLENSVAERILVTGSPVYRRAFDKKLLGREVTPEESAILARAASLTTTAGGFAVPYTLDPTIIRTSNYVVNPIRRIARTETITGNIWNGVSSAGVVASYAGEAAEATDNAATLAQPQAQVERAQAFIPFSIEIGQDWGGFQAEMAGLFQDAKDELESVQFLTGLGHTGGTAPEGLLVGGTAVVSTAVATTIAVGDLYALEEAVPPRFRPNSSIVANKKQFNRVRAFDVSGGSSLWVQLGDGMPRALLGYPNYEWSSMSSAITSAASAFTMGDFRHYLIVDRIGMDVELIPQLFGANRMPTGQRGLYAIWRNTGKVLAWQAFRTLKVT